MHNRSGMALVLALMAISFLVAITVQLFTTVNWQVTASSNYRDSVSIDAMNRAALNIARASLFADQKLNNYDCQFDEWNRLDREELHALLGSDKITIKVTDLSGKLQVNALVSQKKDPQQQQQQQQQQAVQYDIWRRFLTSGSFAIENDDQAVALIEAIIDWIDSNDLEHDHGAEDGYYLALENPYLPRNGPLQSLEELLLVKGMTPEIFYGTEEYSGISDYLTVYGTDGKININSAPAPVLKALADGMDDEIVEAIIDYRQDEDNKDSLGQQDWYTAAAGFPGYIVLPKDVIAVNSYYFQVDSTVNKDNLSRTGHAILLRDDNKEQQLLRWDID